ncbi:glycosyltransferase [Devosia sp. A369]
MPKSPPPKILFAAYGGGHITMLAPVALAMAERGYQTRILALTTAQAYLDDRDISYFGYRDLPEAIDPEVQRHGRILVKDQDSAASKVRYDESVAYHGINFRDLMKTCGESRAYELYALRQRQAFLPVRTMINLLERERPDLIVVTNSPRSEQALVMAGKLLGVPTVCLVDLLDVHRMPAADYPDYADKFLVLNEGVRQTFLSYGCAPEQVVATGNPAFDRLMTAETIAAGRRLRHERGWSGDEKIILWASQVEPAKHPFNNTIGDPSLPRRIEQELRRFVATELGTRLVVRYHPNEQVSFVPGERIDFSPTKEDLSALLLAVDVVVVTTSTVGVEAQYVGKPVVSVDTSVLYPDGPFRRIVTSTSVGELSDLGPKLLGVLRAERPVSRWSKDLWVNSRPAVEQVIEELQNSMKTIIH